MSESATRRRRGEDIVLAATGQEQARLAALRLGELLAPDPRRSGDHHGKAHLFPSREALAKAVRTEVFRQRRIAQVDENHPPTAKSLGNYFSSLFNGDPYRLPEYVEAALQRAIAEELANRYGARGLDREWRGMLSECLLILSEVRIGGHDDSLDRIYNSVDWADSVHVVSSRFDPLMLGWPEHPLDLLVRRLAPPAATESDASNGPQLVLVCASSYDAHAWLRRMILPFIIAKYRKQILGGASSREQIAEMIEPFVNWIGVKLDKGYVRTHIVPGPACWISFFRTGHGRLRQTYLNLPGKDTLPRFVVIPSEATEEQLRFPLRQSDYTRHTPCPRCLGSELVEDVLRTVEEYQDKSQSDLADMRRAAGRALERKAVLLKRRFRLR